MNYGQEDYLPYGHQLISEEDIKAVNNVLRSEFITQGPLVNEFEKAISNKVSAEYGVAVNSATSALHLGCLSLGLGPEDWLWTSPITFVASANCARYCGANVDFVDIDPETGLLSIKALERKLDNAKKQNKLPKILIPVHLGGSSCDMKSIGELSEKYGFSVIEDASHAIGSSYEKEPVGNCKYSSITVFSFHPVKIITTGEGGIATTNDSALSRNMHELRSHGIVKDKNRLEASNQGEWFYEQQQLGFNYRISDIQCALGLSQLKRLDEIVKERNRLLTLYRNRLSGLPVKLLKIPENVNSSVHLGIIRLKDQNADHHKKVFGNLRSNGIGVQLHYNPVHLNPYYRRLGYNEGDFPNSELYGKNAISLPLFPGLKMSSIERVARELESAINLSYGIEKKMFDFNSH